MSMLMTVQIIKLNDNFIKLIILESLQKTFNEATEAYRLMNDIYTNLRHSLMKTEMQTKSNNIFTQQKHIKLYNKQYIYFIIIAFSIGVN